MIKWSYFLLYRRCHVVGWMRKGEDGRIQFLDGIRARWNHALIEHDQAVQLDEVPPAFQYERWSRL